MKSATFGLDIGTTAIRAVYLSKEKQLLKYETAFSAQTPVISMQSESQFDQQELAQIIKKLVLDAKISTKEVSVALPELQVFTKVIEMPLLSEKEVSSAIYWEAEQYIPAPLETMTLDWSILYKPKDISEKMRVLLVAAPIKLLNRYKSILELAGLSVVFVETEILSIIRSVVQSDRFPTSLIIHIGALSTSFCIVQNGLLVFNDTLPLGGIAMTRALSVDFGFSPTQAEEYKRTYGISDKNFGGKIGNALSPILTEIVSEIKKALIFYKEKYHNESPISQILLTGGGVNLPGLDIYLAQHLGIETLIANPWKLRGIYGVPQDVQLHSSEYVVSLGLALKEYE